ncbi:hypothetical protein DD238_008488 [Peronospora effusa]|uniref:Uncharacterized protein n=1 Tax=Peronospora effusa TaxID=542832 RepID=A0A3M6VEK4_9STRA|nr:hypothetical protein DD238_008488 [Peronospora effusa]
MVDESLTDENDVQPMNATASDSHASRNKKANEELFDPESFSPQRASTRIRKRTGIASDGTGSAAPSLSSRNSRKCMRVASVFAESASKEVSGLESLDASASEADTKLREESEETMSPAKHAPARRTGNGNEEEHGDSEALPSVAEKEDDDEENEKTRNVEQEEEQLTSKRKKNSTENEVSKKKVAQSDKQNAISKSSARFETQTFVKFLLLNVIFDIAKIHLVHLEPRMK